jgi:DNA-binding transcriptional regulator YiaG
MNIATALKSEISRVARKELRGETQGLKRSSAQHRSDIASLKRRVLELERMVKRLGKLAGKSVSAAKGDAPNESGKVRFSAKGLAAQRTRLGLSAADMGALLGVSGQSVYHWEQGKSRPRASQMPAIAAVRKMGRREAAMKLAQAALPPRPSLRT